MNSFRTFGAACVVALLAGHAVCADAAGNAQRGKELFLQCSACHSLIAGKNGIGPSLHGLFGRKAGSVPGYDYSAAMKKSNVVWNEETLDAYLTNPHKYIPGDKMPFMGLANPQQRQDVIAYLEEATK